ncbi:MAG: hypothetical protein ACYTGZ_10075 [Planctomycetota bacterium]|jgi:hypothetical protein
MGQLEHQAHRVLDRIELRFGIDAELRGRLFPIVTKVLSLGTQEEERKPMLRLVAEAYAHHIRVREVVEELDDRLRNRITANFAEMLGIEPPNLNVE